MGVGLRFLNPAAAAVDLVLVLYFCINPFSASTARFAEETETRKGICAQRNLPQLDRDGDSACRGLHRHHHHHHRHHLKGSICLHFELDPTSTAIHIIASLPNLRLFLVACSPWFGSLLPLRAGQSANAWHSALVRTLRRCFVSPSHPPARAAMRRTLSIF